MVEASGTRITWTDLPRGVRSQVEAVLGGRVVEATSQRGGLSPGTADRVITDAGRRAFVKAVHPDLNADSALMHRREAQVVAAVPEHLPVPALLGSFEADGWVVLVLADVEGHVPGGPWRAEDLDAVLAALGRVSAEPFDPAPPSLTAIATHVRPLFDGWSRIAADPPDGLDPWAVQHLEHLVVLAGGAADAVAGDRLVHGDLRADNVLVRGDGSAVLVDWAHAALGCSWLDALTLLLDVRRHDGAGALDVEALLAPAVLGVDPRAVTAVLAGLSGYFVDAARLPGVPGLPTLRAFQAAEGAAALAWVRERLGDASRDG